MPTYEYLCTACKNEWEEVQRISEDALEICPKCGDKTAKRQISAGNFILKGGGWYADLYSSSPKAKPGGDGKTEGAPDAKKPDGAAAPAAAAGAAKSEGGGTGGSASPAASPTASPSTSTGTSGGTTSGGGSSGGGKASGSST